MEELTGREVEAELHVEDKDVNNEIMAQLLSGKERNNATAENSDDSSLVTLSPGAAELFKSASAFLLRLSKQQQLDLQQRDADMRLFSGPPPTLYSSTQCPLSLARSHCRGVSQVERRSDALGWPDAQIWTFILVTHNSGPNIVW